MCTNVCVKGFVSALCMRVFQRATVSVYECLGVNYVCECEVSVKYERVQADNVYVWRDEDGMGDLYECKGVCR